MNQSSHRVPMLIAPGPMHISSRWQGRVGGLVLLLSLIATFINYTPAWAGADTPIAPLTNTTAAPVFPNDPSYQAEQQYGLDLINVRPAWEYTVGDPRVVVALIDTGIDFTHPEFAGRIHPDAHTFFLQSSPVDESGHGTRTAGIIGASINNQRGMAGIAGNVQILPIKVSPGVVREGEVEGREAQAVDYNFQEPIRYAASPNRHGTRVININFATSLDDPEERAAIYEATSNGALVLAAAGNTGKEQTLFPAAYDCVVGVGAVDQSATRAGFSTYGLGVDVVAPGVNIFSTALHSQQHDYDYASGTSFATPHASGVAALIFSARPELTAWDVREILLRSAKDLGQPGYDVQYGYGLLDAGAALQLASIWRAGSGKALATCTGERYRVYGSLYLDTNNNGQRDSNETAYTEPYTNTTTFVELYANNGARLLDRTFANHAGIYTFDITYRAEESPYLVKLQNGSVQQSLYFAGGLAGPYDFAMNTRSDDAVTLQGSFFADRDADGVMDTDESLYPDGGQYPATVALYALQQAALLAVATSDQRGHFAFYIAPPTMTMTYELRPATQDGFLRFSRPYTLTLEPTSRGVLTYALGLDIDTIPVLGQDSSVNSTPVALQAMTATGSIVLQWDTPQALRADSIYEIAYATQSGGPYQAVGATSLPQTTSYTIFNPHGGRYYLVVRARTRDDAQGAFWSGYSNEVTVTVPAAVGDHQLYLPYVSR
ncbi:MAG: S8 family serine peptidase [Caldilineaceae bacterium]